MIAYELHPSRRVIAVVMALGTGLLIGSVSFELIDEALNLKVVPGLGAHEHGNRYQAAPLPQSSG